MKVELSAVMVLYTLHVHRKLVNYQDI